MQRNMPMLPWSLRIGAALLIASISLYGIGQGLLRGSAIVGWLPVSPSVPTRQIRFTQSSLSLEVTNPADQLTGVVGLINPTAAPVAFRLSTTCGCSGVTPRTGTLAPGETLDLQVNMNSPQVRGARQGAAVLLIDAEQREIGRCELEAIYPSLLEFTPRALTLTAAQPGEPMQAEVALSPLGPQGHAALSQATVVARQGRIDRLDLVADDGTNWRLRVVVNAAPKHDLSDTIAVMVGAEPIATLPVSLNISRSIVLVPSRVTPRRTPDGYAVELLARFSHATPAERVTVVEDPTINVAWGVGLTPRVRRLELTLSQLPPSGELTLCLGSQGETAKLTLLPETKPETKR